MATNHRARVTWSSEQVRRGLPAISTTVDPAWFSDTEQRTDRWSLMCAFKPRPDEQGNPTTAVVRFMMDNAPHERLRPGAALKLFERGTQQFATVEILD